MGMREMQAERKKKLYSFRLSQLVQVITGEMTGQEGHVTQVACGPRRDKVSVCINNTTCYFSPGELVMKERLTAAAE